MLARPACSTAAEECWSNITHPELKFNYAKYFKR
ncbi:MAG: hypothetical protein ACI9BW_004148, partial [Gammaproteobacteria bacterium]